MAITLNDFARISPVYNQQIDLSSTSKKIIVVIALAALACLAAYYFVRCSRFKAAIFGDDPKQPLPTPIAPPKPVDDPILTFDQLMDKARNEFKSDPNKDAIIRRIEDKLKSAKYEERALSGERPGITLSWEDTLWGPYSDTEPQQSKIISRATDFLEKYVCCLYAK